MRVFNTGVVLLFAGTSFASAQITGKKDVPPPPRADIKVDFSYFENWGMKVKSFNVELHEPRTSDKGTPVYGRVVYVLEFGRDVVNYELDAMQRVFLDPSKRLRHVYFDADNVALPANLFYPLRLQGELSGVQGESIRIVVEFGIDPTPVLRQARRFVVRAG